MKTDLVTAIVTTIIGFAIAYFITNLFIGPIDSFSYTTVDSSSINANIAEPNNEVFNYKALNPTVEVYVGDCTEYDENGVCLDDAQNSNLNQEE